MNVTLRLLPGLNNRLLGSFVFVMLSLANGACSSQESEFERNPVVRRFIAGPVEFRFYASPSTDGGAATNFKVGESLYLVSTLANSTGVEQVCEPDYSKIIIRCDSLPSLFLRRKDETLWDDKQAETIGIPCGEDIDLSDWDLPKQITIPADFVMRSFIEVRPKEALPVGEYTAEWRIPNEPLNALFSSCGFATAITMVTLSIAVWPE